jgi:hypothetical protein
VSKIIYIDMMKLGSKEGHDMDSLFSGILSLVNISCLGIGFYVMKSWIGVEENEMRQYRRMTELEIRLLNKKLEAKDGRSSGC